MMISRVVTIQTQPGKLDDAIRIYREGILPLVSKQSGYQSVMLLSEPNTNKLMIVGLWESEAQLKAADADPSIRDQLGRFRETFAVPPAIENLTVSLHAAH
jgi:heme-degrading monooxygenase HmoA